MEQKDILNLPGYFLKCCGTSSSVRYSRKLGCISLIFDNVLHLWPNAKFPFIVK